MRAFISHMKDNVGVSASESAKAVGMNDRSARSYISLIRERGEESVVAMCEGEDTKVEQPVNRQPYIEKNIAPAPDAFGRLIKDDLPDSVLVVSDLQFPFAHKDCLNFLSMVAQRYNCELTVGIGDEVDNNFMSAYEKDPNIMGASQEFILARENMAQFFKLFPRGYGLHSNHGAGRIRGCYQRAGLPNELRPKYEDFLAAPKGWGWYTEVRLGNVLFRHGDGEKGLNKPMLIEHTPAEYGRHYSVVHGHVHEKIGRQAHAIVGDNEYWAAYTGCLISPYSHAFGYTKGRKAKLGCGVIVHGEWKTIRLKEDADGRWIGKL